ncbi:MAG: translation initiation factor [Polyangiales bacterium]
MTTKPKSPFAALEALRDSLPAGEAKPPAPVAEAPIAALGEKIVVARSKKGRGGKTVTTIAGIRGDARESLAHDLRRALGCGASVDEALVVVQGDQLPRVRAFLEARGVRKVVVGS